MGIGKAMLNTPATAVGKPSSFDLIAKKVPIMQEGIGKHSGRSVAGLQRKLKASGTISAESLAEISTSVNKLFERK